MNKLNNTYRILSIFMAFLVLMTSVGISVDMHYCGGELKTVNFFGKAKSCHNEAAGIICPHHAKQHLADAKHTNSVTKKSCCENKLQHFQADQDRGFADVDFVKSESSINQDYVFAFDATFIKKSVLNQRLKSAFHYQPPTISRDTYALFEVFLI